MSASTDGQRLFELVDEWVDRTRRTPSEVQPGSDLAADDEATDYLHVSHMVLNSLFLAVDQLAALRTMIVEAQRLHTSPPFTLIRSALENAAVAVWLLAPEDARERRLRRLRLAISDAKDAVSVFDLVGHVGRSFDERRDDIVAIAARSGIRETELGTRQPGYERIVEEAGRHLGGSTLYLVVWKGCSGLAHGRQWATVALLRHKEQSRLDNVATLEMTAALPSVLNAATAAALMLKRGWELFDDRRRRWYGQRRPPPWLVQ